MAKLMMSLLPYFRKFVLLLLPVCLIGCNNPENNDESIALLILSGRNNHDWEQTTPVLSKIFEETKRFSVDYTNRPDTLNFEFLQQYDAILSNWNSWPDNDLRWPKVMEEGLIRYLKEGGGLVFFHASTSVFYQWPNFQNISTAAWVEQTFHGENCPVMVSIDNQNHPITKGLSDFHIFDELWIDAGSNEEFQVLGYATKTDTSGVDCEKQPAIFVSHNGQGRIFHTLLGHDARALRNTGFKTLITRAAEWAATGEVAATIPQEMEFPGINEEANYSWISNDTTYGLVKNKKTIWQFNFNTRFGKPFFHPIYLDQNRITCASPDDHPWHLGQWFSWKYINGVNYWEYIGESFRSEGVTNITNIELIKHPDCSADISLELDYSPKLKGVVLKEKRSIHVSAPVNDRIVMDYSMTFEALANEVILDRTPIEGEPDGKTWGGYAGLSIRFNQDFMDSNWSTAKGNNMDVNGTNHNWLYMGFRGLNGNRIGSVIFISHKNRKEGEAWYLIDDPENPFFYFSPACLYLKPITLLQGEKLHFNYRIMHLTGPVTREIIESEYQHYTETINHQSLEKK